MTLTATAAPIYNNLTPNTQIAVASRPAGASVTEIEAADDFVLSSQTTLNSASLIGRFVPGVNGLYP
ncbi:MAG TPA: hypothetical protein VK663_02910, partial [Burkholderiales bacterium]|nr:hypothetical protein [Burkholderiales bacterium]